MLLSQRPNRHDGRRGRLVRRGPRSRGRVLKPGDTTLPEPLHPLRDGAVSHRKRLSRRDIRPSFMQDALDHSQPGCRRGLRITMELHPGPPLI
jgi:hypothetical protein